jgi:uncharacterized protein
MIRFLIPLVALAVAAPAPSASAQEPGDPGEPVARARPQIPVPPLPYAEEEFTVLNPADGVTLAGTLTLPPGAGPFPAVLLVSGSGTQDRDYGNYPWNHRTFHVLADQLTRRGVAVLRLDDRGIGGSGGERNATNDLVVGDALTALELLRNRSGVDATRVGIIGHSWGGMVAALAAARGPDVRFLIALAGSFGMTWADKMTAQRVAVAASYGGTEERIADVREHWSRLQAAAMSHPDSAVAAARVHEVMDRYRADMTAMHADVPAPSEERWQEVLHQQTRVLVNRWYMEQLHVDPADFLPHIRMPVLGLTGSIDTTSPPELLEGMRDALAAAGNDRVTIEVLPHINHFLQTVAPGGPEASNEIEETVAPVLVERIVAWLGQLGVLADGPYDPGSRVTELAIVGATIVDTENGHLLPNTTILVTGNRIQALGPTAGIRVPPRARVIDGRGKYVIPGLIDTHTHFGMAEEGLPVIRETDPILRFLLANGVTAARDAHGAGREVDLVRLRDRVERGEAVAPRLYVSGTANLGNVEVHGAIDLRDLVRRLAVLGVDGIKIIYTSRDEALAVISEAKQVGLPVYGHTWVYGGPWYGRPDLSFDFDGYTLAAVEAGLTGVMHGHSSAPQPTTAMPPPPPGPLDQDNFLAWWLHTRSRWVHASEADLERLLSAMLANGTSLEPNLIVDHVYAHPGRYRPYVGDPHMGQTIADLMSVYEGDDLQVLRAALERQMEFVRLFHEAGGLVVAGTDNHPAPGFGIHDEMRLLVEAGLPPLGALQAATLNAARALGWQERLGTIAPGKLADLVLLDANPLEDILNTRTIHAVILNGRVVDRAELDALLTPAPW